jgi:triphosphoribosyl-dephospho-CoA synthase
MDISEKIGLAAELCCLLEVSAEKPGNVTPTHDFKDTRYIDFLISGAAIGRAFRNVSNSTVGEIILNAVKDTKRVTCVNTNLGIILLLAPLAKAFSYGEIGDLKNNLGHILKNISVDDARLAYEAIRIASPGGMGKVGENDITDTDVNITLLEAMEQAKDRDSIAREYVTGYEITLEIGLPVLQNAISKRVPISDAIVQTFLIILSQVPDTLIGRKQGMDNAKNISNQALEVINSGGIFTEKGRNKIKALDTLLRKGERSFALDNRLNPGTTADLTAAVLFVYLMENALKITKNGYWIQ